jgi:hypothetical protein
LERIDSVDAHNVLLEELAALCLEGTLYEFHLGLVSTYHAYGKEWLEFSEVLKQLLNDEVLCHILLR